MGRDEILDDLFKSNFLNDLVYKITSGGDLKDDLRQELALILCEMDESRIVEAYEGNYLKYLCVNILKKQFHSSSSPFYKKFRKLGLRSVEFIDNYEEEFTSDSSIDDIITKVKWIVDNKLNFIDRELFKLYYKWDRYDRWLGDLKDESCDKPMSSYRKIERKLCIGGDVTIDHSTIGLSHNRSIKIIRKWLKKLNEI